LGTRIQLCGPLRASIDGQRVEDAFAGRQGRLLFAYLVAHRLRPSSRDELIDAIWADAPPAAVDSALSALVSKLRKVVGADRVEGRTELRLVLPENSWIDVEAATAGIHRAESAVRRGDWHDAWVAARIAQHITIRPFMAGDDAPWVEDRRQELEGVYLRSLELAAHASVGIGGGELDTAERTARTLVRLAPFRESGYRYLMQALDAQDNRAEALRVYEQLRVLLREELGITPSPATQELYKELLA
jgi:DNA-binding SARP family transcriptional activator